MTSKRIRLNKSPRIKAEKSIDESLSDLCDVFLEAQASKSTSSAKSDPAINPIGSPVLIKSEIKSPSTSILISPVLSQQQSTSPIYEHDSQFVSDINKDVEINDNTVQSGHLYPSFGKLKPKFIEFTGIFPQFPKTHPDGYAYVIDLPLKTLNEASIKHLRESLQYSMTGGGGARSTKNVTFFATKTGNAEVMAGFRQCAGITFQRLHFIY